MPPANRPKEAWPGGIAAWLTRHWAACAGLFFLALLLAASLTASQDSTG